ncbi:hypothetical protein HDU97_000611, partial [Phlyctochytrium planicorne]
MLLGINRFLEDNPQLTPADLLRPEIRAELTIKKFQGLGYNGATALDVDFEDDGGLNAPMFFFAGYGRSFIYDSNYMTDDLAFAISNPNGFVVRFHPLLNGNSTVWPTDDFSIEILVAYGSIIMYIVLAMGSLAAILNSANIECSIVSTNSWIILNGIQVFLFFASSIASNSVFTLWAPKKFSWFSLVFGVGDVVLKFILPDSFLKRYILTIIKTSLALVTSVFCVNQLKEIREEIFNDDGSQMLSGNAALATKLGDVRFCEKGIFG